MNANNKSQLVLLVLEHLGLLGGLVHLLLRFPQHPEHLEIPVHPVLLEALLPLELLDHLLDLSYLEVLSVLVPLGVHVVQ